MRVRIVKTREYGVELDRRTLREAFGHPGILAILDVTDQGLRRPTKVARLVSNGECRCELSDVGIVWMADGRFTLTGFERVKNELGKLTEFRQSWICILDDRPQPMGSTQQR